MKQNFKPSKLRAGLLPCVLAAWSAAASAQTPAAPAAPAASATTTAADAVVLRAGSFALSKAEYEQLSLGFDRASGALLSGSELRSRQSGQDTARLLALVSEAQKRGLDQTPRMQALIRVRGYTLLANALRLTLTAEARKDEAGTRALYEKEKDKFVDLRVRQILVSFQGAATDPAGGKPNARTEAQAKALALSLRDKLKAGADFSQLAKARSDDALTRNKGGELVPFGRGATVAEFESAVFALQTGVLSEPIKTKYGYHLVEVLERRPYSFERLRATLEFTRGQEAFDAIADSGIKLDESYFKP